MDLHAVKRKYGQEVLGQLNQLPEYLGASAVDLLSRLARHCPPGGFFWDFGAGDDGYPAFDTLLNFFEEAGLADQRSRHAVFVGFSFALLAAAADESALDQGPNPAQSFLPLSQAFLLEAEQSFGAVFSSQSAFNGMFRKAWQEHVEYFLWHQANHIAARTPYRDQDWLKTGQRWAPLKTGFTAVLCACGKEAGLPSLNRLLDELNALFQIKREIVDIRRDAARQVHSMAIDRIAACIPGMAVDRPEALLGTLLLFNPIPGLIGDCVERLAFCRELCRQLAVTSFEPVIARFHYSFLSLESLFSLTKKVKPPRGEADALPLGKARGFVVCGDAGLPDRIRAAGEYLLADPEFHESWEVHRWGFLGEATLTGRVFPGGFILELLLDSGLHLPGRLEALFSHWCSIDCRYFDEACQLPPDADSLGLMLRLMRFSGNREAHTARLRPVLNRMLANVAENGDIPTYFTAQPPGEAPREYFKHLAGNECTGVRVGLLLGLLQCKDGSCQAIARRLLSRLLETVATSGDSTNVYYPPGYWLWMMFRLLDPETDHGVPPSPDMARRALEVLREKLDRLDNVAHLSVQQAAWLVLCRSTMAGRGDIHQDWLRTIALNQRHDGGWDAEPFYRVPTWNNQTAWHTSRLLTSAVCRHALVHCTRRGMVA